MPRVISSAASFVSQRSQRPSWNCRIATQNNVNFSSGEVMTNYSTSSGTHRIFGGINFDASNGLAYVPCAGLYYVGTTVRYDAFAGNYFYIDIQHNGSTINRSLDSENSNYVHRTVHAVRDCAAGDYFRLVFTSNGDTSVTVNDDSYFFGHLIDG